MHSPLVPIGFLSVDSGGAPFLRQYRLAGILIAAAIATIAFGLGRSALGQVAATLTGPPVQVQPYAPEPGVRVITITPGTLNPFSGADGLGTGTAGVGDGSGTGNGNGVAGGTGGGGVGSGEPLSTMLGQPWGAAAVSNAQALGVNASALAATCAIESGCQNIGGPGSVAGAFQMTAATYTAMINAATAQNPNLASQVVPGLAGQMDPATESIAAAEYLHQGAQYLQNNGISNPTVLDVRGYYNFGPQGGAQLANAQDSNSIANVLNMYTLAQLAANGITPGETVGQWRSSVANKIGNVAGQSVLM